MYCDGGVKRTIDPGCSISIYIHPPGNMLVRAVTLFSSFFFSFFLLLSSRLVSFLFYREEAKLSSPLRPVPEPRLPFSDGQSLMKKARPDMRDGCLAVWSLSRVFFFFCCFHFLYLKKKKYPSRFFFPFPCTGALYFFALPFPTRLDEFNWQRDG